MSRKKIVVLDGSALGDEHLVPARAELSEVFGRDADVRTFALRDIKLTHCAGCFGCWLETPGVCVQGGAAREIAAAIMESDTTVLFSPVVFGGYSPELKLMVDHFLPLVLPYFGIYRGETHHMPRYARYPRLVGVGVQRHHDEAEADVFKVLLGRNAINFHAPSYAAAVVGETDGPDVLRRTFEGLLTAQDPWPMEAELTSLLPSPADAPVTFEIEGRPRALLLVGSPKVKAPSTSSVLGGYVLDDLTRRGWETETIRLKGAIRTKSGQDELLAASDRADIVIVAFPLYIDCLPILVGEALQVISEHRKSASDPRPQRLAVISNNGFPEAYQNHPAIAICREAALQSGMTWAGGLAMGAGEAISSGRPLDDARGDGLPTAHVTYALDRAAACLHEGRPVSDDAAATLAGVPVPGMPANAWRGVFIQMAGQHWDQEAAEHGVTRERILEHPYAP